jgi:hypothetical protein
MSLLGAKFSATAIVLLETFNAIEIAGGIVWLYLVLHNHAITGGIVWAATLTAEHHLAAAAGPRVSLKPGVKP